MKIIRRDLGDVVVLALAGRLDQASADALHAAAMEVVGEKRKGLVVEMTGVDFIASVGIRALIRPAQGMSLNRGRLAISDLKPQLRDFFVTTGLDQMFAIYDTSAEAADALGS